MLKAKVSLKRQKLVNEFSINPEHDVPYIRAIVAIALLFVYFAEIALVETNDKQNRHTTRQVDLKSERVPSACILRNQVGYLYAELQLDNEHEYMHERCLTSFFLYFKCMIDEFISLS